MLISVWNVHHTIMIMIRIGGEGGVAFLLTLCSGIIIGLKLSVGEGAVYQVM